LRFSAGGVHGLVGENGAGKSTVVRMLSGVIEPDAGRIIIRGDEVQLRSPRQAFHLGISTAFQELTLAPQLSVAQNLFMGWQAEPTSKWLTSHRALERRATALLAHWGIHGIDAFRPVEQLSLAEQQRLELVRAFSRARSLLLLDEPTAALTEPGVEWLFSQIRKVTERGLCVVYISHRLDEVRTICSELTVLSDGRSVGTLADPASASPQEVVKMMAGGRSIGRITAAAPDPRPPGDVQLAAEALSFVGAYHDVTLAIRSGEILGIVALEGSGQRELFLSLFGALRPTSGQLSVAGRQMRLRNPAQAVRHRIALIPEDRKAGGLLLDSSSTVNMVLPSLPVFTRVGFYRYRLARERAGTWLQRMQVKFGSLEDRVGALSGGNQQKVVLAKWLLAGSQTYLMYDPTRGVDLETKDEIYIKLRELAADGAAILLYSTDIEEVLQLSTRLMVMYRGRIKAEFDPAKANRAHLVAAMVGSEGAQ
jgi:ABC-type sugar transport system ATPase subunit